MPAKTQSKNPPKRRAKPKAKPKRKARRLGPKRKAAIAEKRAPIRARAELKRQTRRESVGDMLMEGNTYRECAQELNCGLATIHRDVHALLADWRVERVSKVDDVLVMQNRLLDRAQRGILKDVGNGELSAIAALLAIIDRRMKLYGLDAKAVFDHWLEILAPDEQARSRNTGRLLAAGLRDIQTIVERHGGGDLPLALDHDDGGAEPIN